MNEYRSHIQANFIVYCMQNDINLFIISPHCSHMLQPFNVDIFAVFKQRYIIKIYIINWLNLQCILYIE